MTRVIKIASMLIKERLNWKEALLPVELAKTKKTFGNYRSLRKIKNYQTLFTEV